MATEGQRTILGFDYGLKRIGVALGMEITRTARPLSIVACHDGKPVWQSITALIEEWHPDLLVVGLPVTPLVASSAAGTIFRSSTSMSALPR